MGNPFVLVADVGGEVSVQGPVGAGVGDVGVEAGSGGQSAGVTWGRPALGRLRG